MLRVAQRKQRKNGRERKSSTPKSVKRIKLQTRWMFEGPEVFRAKPDTFEDHRKQRVSPRSKAKSRSTKCSQSGGRSLEEHPQEMDEGFEPAAKTFDR